MILVVFGCVKNRFRANKIHDFCEKIFWDVTPHGSFVNIQEPHGAASHTHRRENLK
jgi:hypothetical protein